MLVPRSLSPRASVPVPVSVCLVRRLVWTARAFCYFLPGRPQARRVDFALHQQMNLYWTLHLARCVPAVPSSCYFLEDQLRLWVSDNICDNVGSHFHSGAPLVVTRFISGLRGAPNSHTPHADRL